MAAELTAPCIRKPGTAFSLPPVWVHPGPACSAPPKPHTPGQPGGCVRTVVVFTRPPGCVHVQPDRLISKSQPSPSRHGSMSHHCFVLTIRAVDRGQRSAPAGRGGGSHAAQCPAPASGTGRRGGQPLGPIRGPGQAPPLPWLPVTHLLSGGSSAVGHSVSRDRGPWGQCQGAPKAPSWRGRHCSLLCLEPT